MTALDRLGPSLSGVIANIETVTEHQVLRRSLREGIDYCPATSKMRAGIFAALAGYERELMHERAPVWQGFAGDDAARFFARHLGWPPGGARRCDRFWSEARWSSGPRWLYRDRP